MFSKILRQIPEAYRILLGVLESADQSVPSEEVSVARRVIRAITRPALWVMRRVFCAITAVTIVTDDNLRQVFGPKWRIVINVVMATIPIGAIFALPRLWAMWVFGALAVQAICILATLVQVGSAAAKFDTNKEKYHV